jgi:hypothetical protein
MSSSGLQTDIEGVEFIREHLLFVADNLRGKEIAEFMESGSRKKFF